MHVQRDSKQELKEHTLCIVAVCLDSIQREFTSFNNEILTDLYLYGDLLPLITHVTHINHRIELTCMLLLQFWGQDTPIYF